MREAILAVDILTAQTDTAEEYLNMLERHGDAARKEGADVAWDRHTLRWREIWEKSTIEVLRSTNSSQNVTHLTQMYIATRSVSLYMALDPHHNSNRGAHIGT